MASGNGSYASQHPHSHSQTISAKTYARASTELFLPKKDQAVIVDAIENFTNDDYIDAIDSIIQEGHVRFISKVSGNRIKIYFSEKSLVEKVTENPTTIKGQTLKFRPLLENNKRLVISNVDPTIPHGVLLDVLKSKSIVPVSSMHYLRTGLQKPGRANILSFRRQVYIKEEDVQLVPESAQILYDDTPYWIYNFCSIHPPWYIKK